jgi:hypothetical protein
MPAMIGVIVAARRSKKGSSEMPNYDLRINGSARQVDSSDAGKPLLYVLRGLGLTATKSRQADHQN